jgi:hypothetical protein
MTFTSKSLTLAFVIAAAVSPAVSKASYGTGEPVSYGTGEPVSYRTAPVAPLHRPGYRFSKRQAEAGAWRECTDKLFASFDDCLTAGLEPFRPGWRCKSVYGEPRGAWCFKAFATSQEEIAWQFRVKVSHTGETGSGGLPIVQYTVRTYHFTRL